MWAFVVVGVVTQQQGPYPVGLSSSLFVALALGRGGQLEKGNEGRRKQTTIFIVVHFGDTLSRPPTYWVPPHISSSPIPSSRENESAHIPLERGGAGAGASSLVR
jgi:hypothetical protein